MNELRRIRAATLDVGGVFVVPEHRRLQAAFESAGLEVDVRTFWDAHYRAMHTLDAVRSPAETFTDYVPAFCHAVGLRDDDHELGARALAPLYGPSGLWVEPIAESIADLATVAASGLPLAIVSNADGTVADVLSRVGVCQAGPGPAVEVTTVVDSGAIGVAKPDPAIFTPAIEALGVPAADIVHVGDSVHYDVVGARDAGLQAAHFDPRRLCTSDEHAHVRRLTELLDLVA